MFNGKYVPMDFIIERVNRNSVLFRKAGITEYDLAEWIGEALLLIGAKAQYQDNFTLTTIKNYRGKLPCHPIVIESVRSVESGIGARVSTDTFSGSPHTGDANKLNSNGRSLMDEYTIKGDIIHVDTMKDGQVEVKFQSLATDDRGYPLIPDDERTAKAIESYVKVMAFRIMWEIGEVRDAVYRAAEQDWLFYVNSAKTSLMSPSLDEMESLKNMIVRLIPVFSTKSDTGRSAGIREQRKFK